MFMQILNGKVPRIYFFFCSPILVGSIPRKLLGIRISHVSGAILWYDSRYYPHFETLYSKLYTRFL